MTPSIIQTAFLDAEESTKLVLWSCRAKYYGKVETKVLNLAFMERVKAFGFPDALCEPDANWDVHGIEYYPMKDLRLANEAFQFRRESKEPMKPSPFAPERFIELLPNEDGSPVTTAYDRLAVRVEIQDSLRRGGAWLGAARSWMQSNVPRGDTLTWGSAEPITIPFYKLEELALRTAQAAVEEDREKQARKKNPVQRQQLELLIKEYGAACSDEKFAFKEQKVLEQISAVLRTVL